jgi:hypothetical protein
LQLAGNKRPAISIIGRVKLRDRSNQARSCVMALLGAGVLAGCATQSPVMLIPASDRVQMQQEAARNNPQESLTVEAMLANARGKPSKATPDPITLRVVDQGGGLMIPNADLKQLASVADTQRNTVLIAGPSDDTSPVAAALAANRNAHFVAQHLPATLRVTETRYDVDQPPNTVRLDFGGQGIGR